MIPFLLSLLTTVAITLWIVRLSPRGVARSDEDFPSGPQVFHARMAPRTGGAGIAVGVLLGMMAARGQFTGPDLWKIMGLSVAATAAFGIGLLEDITQRVSPARRLLGVLAAAAVASWWAGTEILRTDLEPLDMMLTWSGASIALTLLSVTGVANSVNIIDGFNGLASMCVAIMLAALAYVAYQVGDTLVLTGAVVGLGAALGFFIWNYPFGLIFLGDGGAYFLGFWFAELSILLVQRNETVSPMFPLLLCAYPIFETLFTMYRRRIVSGRPVGLPDATHLHSLIYRRLMRWAVGRTDAATLLRRNSMTSPYLWIICSLSAVPAVLCWDRSDLLASFLLAFCALYLALYRAIVRFRTPRLLVRKTGGINPDETRSQSAG